MKRPSKLPVVYVNLTSKAGPYTNIEVRGEGQELICHATDERGDIGEGCDYSATAQIELLDQLAKAGYLKVIKSPDILKLYP